MIRQSRVNQEFSLNWSFRQTWPAVHVVRVIEQCYFNSTPDPFNGQTASFSLQPPKVMAIETALFYYSGDMYSWSSLISERRGFAFLIFIDLWSCLLTTKLSYAQLFKWGHSIAARGPAKGLPFIYANVQRGRATFLLGLAWFSPFLLS